MQTTNATVRNAIGARAANASRFANFRSMKNSARTELTFLVSKIIEAASILEKDAKTYKNISDATEEERKCIDACLSQCGKCLREVKDRLDLQIKNVMQ